MRSLLLKLVSLSLLMLAIRTEAQINSSQVRFPPVCKVNPLSVYLPYGDTCANLLPAGTGYPGVVSNGANGLDIGGNLSTPAIQSGLGIVANPFWGNGVNNIAGFFSNPLYCNGASKPCAGIVDASYANTERYNQDFGARSNFSMGASQAVLMDYRAGALKFTVHDPTTNTTNYNDSMILNCANTTLQGTSAQANCLHIVLQQHGPGFSNGNEGVGGQGWSVNLGMRVEQTVNTPGISQLLGGQQVKSATGDTDAVALYSVSYGGSTAISDEGNELEVLQGGEAASTYAGNVVTGGTGATQLFVNCTADCSNPGDGRYLMEMQTPIATGTLTGLSGNVLTVDATVPVSTFWGSLNTDVNTPTSIGASTTAMTFAVTQIGGAGAPTAGDLMCFSGNFHEQARITSVTGSGPYTIVANLRHGHGAGSWMMANGTCGTFVEMTSINQSGQGGQVLRFPIDVIGSTDAHSLTYVYFAFGEGRGSGLTVGGGGASAINLSNVGGVVTFSIGGAPPIFKSGANASFSGASDSAFNGTCTNLHTVSEQPPQYTNLACTQTASNGHAGPATASILWGVAPYAFKLYAGAEVLDVQDYSTSPPSINGHFTLEPNNTIWTGAVEEPHHYAMHGAMANNLYSIYNPGGIANGGFEIGFFGAGISGGAVYDPSTMAAMHIRNFNNSNIYAGHGGYLTPSNGATWDGLWNAFLNSELAPEVTFAYLGPPASGVNDPTTTYDLFEANSVYSGQMPLMSYRPFQNTLTFGQLVPYLTVDTLNTGGAISFLPIGAVSDLGSYATTGGSLPDSTTYYYYVVSLDTAFNPSARSSEITVTTGTTGGKNRIRVMWTRPAGVRGYAVCRGSTSGSEQQIYTAPGGNLAHMTFFDDMGNLAPSGGCPNPTTANRGGVEQADHIGINSPGTGFQGKIVAPSGYAANHTFTLPSVDGPLVSFPTTVASMDQNAVVATTTGGPNTFSPGFNFFTSPGNAGSSVGSVLKNVGGSFYLDNYLQNTIAGWTWCTYPNGTALTTPSVETFCYTLPTPTANATLCTTTTCPGGSGIANIQITTGTTAVPANTCTANTAATMTGLLTTSAIVPPTPTSSTTGVVGWGSSGGLGFSYYVTAGTFNWSVCNQTAASITPGGSITWNIGAR